MYLFLRRHCIPLFIPFSYLLLFICLLVCMYLCILCIAVYVPLPLSSLRSTFTPFVLSFMYSSFPLFRSLVPPFSSLPHHPFSATPILYFLFSALHRPFPPLSLNSLGAIRQGWAGPWETVHLSFILITLTQDEASCDTLLDRLSSLPHPFPQCLSLSLALILLFCTFFELAVISCLSLLLSMSGEDLKGGTKEIL